MSATYLFFKPASLPLVAGEMNEASVLPIAEAEVTRCLTGFFSSLQWNGPREARGEVDSGWFEFRIVAGPDGGYLAMRCSLRTDCSQVVQQLCDRFGWVAFDEAARCFQPARPTMQV